LESITLHAVDPIVVGEQMIDDGVVSLEQIAEGRVVFQEMLEGGEDLDAKAGAKRLEPLGESGCKLIHERSSRFSTLEAW